MKTSYKHIRFERHEPEDHKRWFCISKNDDVEIAVVIFYEPWNQWVSAERPDVVMNNSCHIAMAHFLTQLNEAAQ